MRTWLFILCFASCLKVTATTFEGFYVEVIRKYADGKVRNGQYLVNQAQLQQIIMHPNQVISDTTLIPMFNNTSYVYSTILKNDSMNATKVDWNSSVSLYRGKDYPMGRLYQLPSDTNFAFYIKKVSVEIDVVECESYINRSHQAFFDLIAHQILIVNRIYNQEILNQKELLNYGLLLEIVPKEKAWMDFHPANNSQIKVYYEGKEVKQPLPFNLPNW